MNIFNRSISVNIITEDKKTATIVGVFLDTYHEICLTLTADLDTFNILTSVGEFRRTPHDDCHQCESLIPNLAGISFGPGIGKRIAAAVGMESGCTHLSDLAMECIKSLFQGKYTLLHLTQHPDETNSQVYAYLKGTCYHYQVIEE